MNCNLDIIYEWNYNIFWVFRCKLIITHKLYTKVQLPRRHFCLLNWIKTVISLSYNNYIYKDNNTKDCRKHFLTVAETNRRRNGSPPKRPVTSYSKQGVLPIYTLSHDRCQSDLTNCNQTAVVYSFNAYHTFSSCIANDCQWSCHSTAVNSPAWRVDSDRGWQGRGIRLRCLRGFARWLTGAMSAILYVGIEIIHSRRRLFLATFGSDWSAWQR